MQIFAFKMNEWTIPNVFVIECIPFNILVNEAGSGQQKKRETAVRQTKNTHFFSKSHKSFAIANFHLDYVFKFSFKRCHYYWQFEKLNDIVRTISISAIRKLAFKRWMVLLPKVKISSPWKSIFISANLWFLERIND